MMSILIFQLMKNILQLLIDYSMKSYRGDLQYYLGKEELKSIDEDVSFIFGGKEIY